MMVLSSRVEDALAASNLASALIDLEEYGKSHRVIIREPENAFGVFREALCQNLQLDEELNASDNDLIDVFGISEYRVYNVYDDVVEVYIINGKGVLQEQYSGRIGEIVTPDGVNVNSTTIYSKVSFETGGIAGFNIRAGKEKSIDIVRCEDE